MNYYSPDNQLDYNAEVHTHSFNLDGLCEECGMHREELYINLSGVYPDEREETQW